MVNNGSVRSRSSRDRATTGRWSRSSVFRLFLMCKEMCTRTVG